MSLLSPGDIALMHGTMLELSNATLTEIRAPGAPDRSGDPVLGTVLWSGSAEAFLRRERKSFASSEGTVINEEITTLEVYDAAGASVVEAAGPDWEATTIKVIDARLSPAQTRRWTVTGMVHDMDNTLNSVMLELDTETPA